MKAPEHLINPLQWFITNLNGAHFY